MTKETSTKTQKNRFTLQIGIVVVFFFAFIFLFSGATQSKPLTPLIVAGVVVAVAGAIIYYGRQHVEVPVQKAEYQGYWAGYHGLLSQAERYASPETQKAYAEAYSLGKTAKNS